MKGAYSGGRVASPQGSAVNSNKPRLPRLIYFGDVPIEASYHGSALLYRLLETYPRDKLSVIEAGTIFSKPERRLSGVTYELQRQRFARLQTSRFAVSYFMARVRLAHRLVPKLIEAVRDFRAEAILTVTHGTAWIAAAVAASRLGIPLHLICHDEWVRVGPGSGHAGSLKDKTFGRIYRAAKSRLCVSPYMAEENARRYGVEGLVLYPSRAADAPNFPQLAPRLSAPPASFVCGYAGSINSPGYVEAIRIAALSLKQIDGRLLIYGPMSDEQGRQAGLDMSNIAFMGLVPSAQLIDLLREKTDALFVPMSFDPEDRANMELSFPSKLTDYTAAGLPLLIRGPHYCSAVHWAQSNPGAAETVTTIQVEDLAKAFERLATDLPLRRSLAIRAQAIGHDQFSHAAVERILHGALSEF